MLNRFRESKQELDRLSQDQLEQSIPSTRQFMSTSFSISLEKSHNQSSNAGSASVAVLVEEEEAEADGKDSSMTTAVRVNKHDGYNNNNDHQGCCIHEEDYKNDENNENSHSNSNSRDKKTRKHSSHEKKQVVSSGSGGSSSGNGSGTIGTGTSSFSSSTLSAGDLNEIRLELEIVRRRHAISSDVMESTLKTLQKTFPHLSLATIMRHAVVSEGNLNKTESHLNNWIEWRQMTFPLTSIPYCSSEEGCCMYSHGCDLLGHPILLLTPRLSQATEHNREDRIRWLLYQIEVLLLRVPSDLHMYSILVNCTGMKAVDTEFGWRVLEVADKYYPCLLYKMVFYPVPNCLRAAWSVLQRMAGSQAKRLQLCATLEQLQSFMPLKYIPLALGGECTYQFNVADYPSPFEDNYNPSKDLTRTPPGSNKLKGGARVGGDYKLSSDGEHQLFSNGSRDNDSDDYNLDDDDALLQDLYVNNHQQEIDDADGKSIRMASVHARFQCDAKGQPRSSNGCHSCGSNTGTCGATYNHSKNSSSNGINYSKNSRMSGGEGQNKKDSGGYGRSPSSLW